MTAAARAAAIAIAARVRVESDRERIQRENAALFAWRQQFVDMGAPSYMTEFATGRTWGKTAERRAKDAGGLGIAVQASVHPVPAKPIRGKR